MDNKFIKMADGKINFRCKMNDCAHSCCGPFSAITDNLNSVEGRPFDEIVLTEQDYKNIYRAGFGDLIEEAKSEAMNKSYHKMALFPDGTCKAFVDGKCIIQSVKPTLCKAFPFYFDMFSGLCAINCEGFDDQNSIPVSSLSSCFEAARKMYEFWIEFYSTQN